MTELYEKSLRTLELPTVLEMLAGETVSEPAKEKNRALRPAETEYEIKRRLGETSAAKAMMVLHAAPSFGGVKDVRSSLARADIGGMLNTRELLDMLVHPSIRRLLVVNEEHALVGLVSADDLLESMAGELTELAQALRSGLLRETQERGPLTAAAPPSAPASQAAAAPSPSPTGSTAPRRVVFKPWGTPGMPAPEL